MVEVELLPGEGKIVEISSSDFIEVGSGNEITIDLNDSSTVETIEMGQTGPQGLSAYDVAVRNGFVGTEEDWLASLGGTDQFFKKFFEYYSKNLQSFPASLSYTSGKLTSVTYQTSPSTEVVKTLNYTGDKLTSVVFSGDTPASLVLKTKTFTYTGENLTSYDYS